MNASVHALPDVSVVIPSYRRPDALGLCLKSLAVQSIPPLEILVVLRPDDVASRAVAEAAPGPVQVVLVERPGQVAALNRGCESARGEVIAITDDDAAPRSDWLEAVASRFASDPRIGAVGGPDIVHDGDRVLEGHVTRVGRVLWWGRRIGNHHLRSGVQDVDFLKGANMAFRAAAWRPFDSRLRGEGAQVCNDLEATWSVRQRGWRVIYDPGVVVDHYPAARHDGGARNDRSERAEFDEQHNEVYALLRHAAWWRLPILLGYRLIVGTWAAPGLLYLVLPGSSWPRIRRIATARLSALRTLYTSRRG